MACQQQRNDRNVGQERSVGRIAEVIAQVSEAAGRQRRASRGDDKPPQRAGAEQDFRNKCGCAEIQMGQAPGASGSAKSKGDP